MNEVKTDPLRLDFSLSGGSNNDRAQTTWRAFLLATILSCGFFVAALALGTVEQSAIRTLSLIATSIVLETQPAAVASIPLGFSPLIGALVSLFANFIAIPLLIVSFTRLVAHWGWLRRKLERTQRWTAKYLRHGVWALVPLSPFIGAYVSIALTLVLRWRLRLSLLCTVLGMVISTFMLTYFGHWIAMMLHAIRL